MVVEFVMYPQSSLLKIFACLVVLLGLIGRIYCGKVFTALVIDGGSNLKEKGMLESRGKHFHLLLIQHPEGTNKNLLDTLKWDSVLAQEKSTVFSVSTARITVPLLSNSNTFMPWEFNAKLAFNNAKITPTAIKLTSTSATSGEEFKCADSSSTDNSQNIPGACTFKQKIPTFATATGFQGKLNLNNIPYTLNENILFMFTFECDKDPESSFSFEENKELAKQQKKEDPKTFFMEALVAVDCLGSMKETQKLVQAGSGKSIAETNKKNQNLKDSLNKSYTPFEPIADSLNAYRLCKGALPLKSGAGSSDKETTKTDYSPGKGNLFYFYNGTIASAETNKTIAYNAFKATAELANSLVSLAKNLKKLNVFVESFQNDLLTKTFSFSENDIPTHKVSSRLFDFVKNNILPGPGTGSTFFTVVEPIGFDKKLTDRLLLAVDGAFSCPAEKTELITCSETIVNENDTYLIQVRIICKEKKLLI